MSDVKLTFEVFEAKDGWRWRCRAKNKRIVADGGEAYSRRRDAILAVKKFWFSTETNAVRLVLPNDEKGDISRYIVRGDDK